MLVNYLALIYHFEAYQLPGWESLDLLSSYYGNLSLFLEFSGFYRSDRLGHHVYLDILFLEVKILCFLSIPSSH